MNEQVWMIEARFKSWGPNGAWVPQADYRRMTKADAEAKVKELTARNTLSEWRVSSAEPAAPEAGNDQEVTPQLMIPDCVLCGKPVFEVHRCVREPEPHPVSAEPHAAFPETPNFDDWWNGKKPERKIDLNNGLYCMVRYFAQAAWDAALAAKREGK